MKGEYLLIMY